MGSRGLATRQAIPEHHSSSQCRDLKIIMAVADEDYEFYDARRTREDKSGRRFLHVGVVLGLGGLVYMAREFKNRPKDMKISVYLIHTRLFVQGTVIGRSIFLWRKSKKFSGVLSLG